MPGDCAPRATCVASYARIDPLFTMSDNNAVLSLAGRRRALNSITDEPAAFRSLSRHVAIETWWSQTESNRRPPACKAGALPTELWPLQESAIRSQGSGRCALLSRYLIPDTRSLKMVGLGRFELPTSRLSSARSNQLSYKPVSGISNQKSAIRK